VSWEIRCCDCLEGMAALEAESAVLVFADPPYGIGKAAWDSHFLLDWLGEAARVTKKFLVVTPGTSNILSLPVAIGGGPGHGHGLPLDDGRMDFQRYDLRRRRFR